MRLRTVRLDPQGALVADGHPLAVRDAVELADVAEHPIVIHARAANPTHFDFIEGLFRSAGLTARFVERAVAFDPTQRLIREGRAISIVGESATDGLAAGLRWLPFAGDGVRLPVQLVLRAGEPAGVSDRFERVAIAHAASAGWLDRGATRRRGSEPRPRRSFRRASRALTVEGTMQPRLEHPMQQRRCEAVRRSLQPGARAVAGGRRWRRTCCYSI